MKVIGSISSLGFILVDVDSTVTVSHVKVKTALINLFLRTYTCLLSSFVGLVTPVH